MPGRTPASQRRRSASVRPGRYSGDLLGKADVVLVFAAPLGQEHLPLDETQMVEEEDSVEVVDFMLDGAGLQAYGFFPVWVALRIERLDDYPLRPGNVAV